MANQITTVEQARAAGAYDAQNGQGAYARAQNTPVSINYSPNISAQQIMQGSSPIITPPKTVGTAAAGLQGVIDASQAQYSQVTGNVSPYFDQGVIDQGNAANDILFSRLNDIYKSQQGEVGLTDDAYSQDVDPLKQELTDITNQINAKALASRRQVETLYKSSGLTQEQAQSQEAALNRQNSAELADLSIIQQAKSNNYSNAKEIADRKVALQLENQARQLDYIKFVYSENKEKLNKEQDKKFQLQIAERERLLTEESNKKKAINDIAMEALRNGADAGTAQKILNSNSQESALGSAGKFIGLIDRQQLAISQGNLAISQANLRINQAELQMKIDANKPIDVSAITNSNAPAEQKNGAVLTAIIGNSKVGEGAKTQIGNVLGVVNSLQDLAAQRTNGKFAGLGFALKENFKALFNKESQESINNKQYVEAISLKTQIWASGASLTEQQTKQVEKLTPKISDSDSVVRSKMNGLANFMYTQAASQLQASGVTYIPEKVNLFATYDLYQQASPEQKAELKSLGLIK